MESIERKNVPAQARRILEEGLRGDFNPLRERLGLGASAHDLDIAYLSIEIAAAGGLACLEVRRGWDEDPRPRRPSRSLGEGDRSLLGRMEEQAIAGAQPEAFSDVETALLALRAGSLRLRRLAATSLEEHLAGGRLSRDEVALIESSLSGLRDLALEYELRQALRMIRGTDSRRILEEEDALFEALISSLEADIAAFWIDDLEEEPLMKRSADERALLFLRLRDAPSSLVRHLAAILEGDDGVVGIEDRRALLESLRYCGDRRLIPSLIALLEAGPPDVALPAARVLGRIRDPRGLSALRSAYNRTIIDSHRAVIAGALGFAGDPIGRELIRTLLFQTDDMRARFAALEAIEALGQPDDVPQLIAIYPSLQPHERTLALYLLGRIGDARALDFLSEKKDDASSPRRLQLEAHESIRVILARLELKGERPRGSATPKKDREERLGHLRHGREEERALWGAFRARLYHLVGLFFVLLFRNIRAIGWFERASASDPSWVGPPARIGALYDARGDYAEALNAYRLAIERAPSKVEAHPMIMRGLSRSFLRRAEELLVEGKEEIARGLVEEALELDLRRAPSTIRFELYRLAKHLGKRASKNGVIGGEAMKQVASSGSDRSSSRTSSRTRDGREAL